MTRSSPDSVGRVDCHLACDPRWHAGLRWLLGSLADRAGLGLCFVDAGRGRNPLALVIGPGDRPCPAARRVLHLPFAGPSGPLDAPVDSLEGRIPLFGALHEGTAIPSPGNLVIRSSDGGRPLVIQRPSQNSTDLAVAVDLLGPAFRELARLEELDPRHRAAFHDGRGLLSEAGKRGQLERPWLDDLALALFDWLDPDHELPRAEPWPEGRPWALCLSHDVDMLYKWRLRSVIRLLLTSPAWALGGQLPRVARQWRELFRTLAGGQDPWWQAEEMLDLEQRHGALSSFLFLAESHDHRTYRYHLGRAAVRALLQRLAHRGADLQLHGGWHSLGRPERLVREGQRFRRAAGRPATVIRQHYLRFHRDHTWADQQAAGFRTDSTLGWNDRPGYRAGTRLPFHPWDPAGGQPHELLEIPLALMDSQFYFERDLDARAARTVIEGLVDQAATDRGLLCVNWHPHVLCRTDYPGLAELYEGLLEQALALAPWCATLAGLDLWWRSRDTGEVRQ